MMNLSRQTEENIRGHSTRLAFPLWKKILELRCFLSNPLSISSSSSLLLEEEKNRLQMENQLLEIELAHLQRQLNEQIVLSSQITQIASYKPEAAQLLVSDYQRSLQQMTKVMQKRIQAVPSRVIFRSFDTWNSSLWIDVGKSNNRQYSTTIVDVNSPVIVGKAIVGIIDYVGESHSRVRLISDHRLPVSVRAARGGEMESLMNEQIESLLQQMNDKKNLPLSLEDKTQLFQLLQQLKEKLQPLKKTDYLAKGELSGSIFSSRLGQNISLRGTGFNYDFADEEGENRDLRSGQSTLSPQSLPILKVNDILVTTGMDGVFPPGFQVAIVSKIGLLKEGDYFYDLEAQPIVPSLNELSLVFILPPISQERKFSNDKIEK